MPGKFLKFLSHCKTYWGFPIENEKDAPRIQHKDESFALKVRGQKGISLLIAIMSISIMVSLVADLIIVSSVQISSAINNRDRMKAEYLAKSGASLGILVLIISYGFDLFQEGPQSPKPTPRRDGGSSIWAILNSIPMLGAEAVNFTRGMSAGKDEKDNDAFGLKGIMSEKIAEKMALFEDSFSIKITDMQARINVNDCRSGRCVETLAALKALFSCPVEKAYLADRDLNADILTARIFDFIQDKTTQGAGYSDVNDFYMNKVPPYKAKGLPLDSLEELRQIEGWDDDIHAIFSPFLSALMITDKGSTQNTKINLNTAPKELIRCLIPESYNGECSSKSNQFYMQKPKNGKSEFAESEKEIIETLKSSFCYDEENETATIKNREKWFDIKSDVFKISVTAQTGEQMRVLNIIVRRVAPKSDDFRRGKMQMKRSYQILNWNIE